MISINSFLSLFFCKQVNLRIRYSPILWYFKKLKLFQPWFDDDLSPNTFFYYSISCFSYMPLSLKLRFPKTCLQFFNSVNLLDAFLFVFDHTWLSSGFNPLSMLCDQSCGGLLEPYKLWRIKPKFVACQASSLLDVLLLFSILLPALINFLIFREQ